MMTGYKNQTGAAAGKLTPRKLLYAAAPALFYMVFLNAVHVLLSTSGITDSQILLQALSVLASLLFLGGYAVQTRLRIRSRKKGIFRYPAAFCYVVAVVLCGVVNNYLFLIIMSVVNDLPSDYWRVAQSFYNQDLFLEIVALCVLGPLAEELVYRGFVYQRLRETANEASAALWSAVLFGVMHFNLVQCVYAFVLGILLAHIVNRTGSLLTAVVAHMAANLISVLWTETDWLGVLNQTGSGQYVAALVSLGLMGMFLRYGNRMTE